MSNKIISLRWTLWGCQTQYADAWQVHGADVQVVNQISKEYIKPEADGMVTNLEGVPLLMRYADCTPILFYDPTKHVAAIAHAGWRGTVAKVAAETVKSLQDEYGCQPKDILAGIGPSICVDCYEVGEEVVAAAARGFGADAVEKFFKPHTESSVAFDLWAANEYVLREAGVQQIEVAQQCTFENTSDWYSHRAEKGRTGRFAAVIALKD